MGTGKNWYPGPRSPRRDTTTTWIDFTTTTSGTISATTVTSAKDCAATIAKTASKTGRYTVTAQDKYRRFVKGHATIIGPDDAAMTAARGVVTVFRDDDLATDGTIEVQFIRPDTYADAELQDGARAILELTFADS